MQGSISNDIHHPLWRNPMTTHKYVLNPAIFFIESENQDPDEALVEALQNAGTRSLLKFLAEEIDEEPSYEYLGVEEEDEEED